ncbi:adenine deaminase [Dehalobacterium formicoaceticum]|uniref:Adenine deaminase n=1 Tax=Dehalobacterium formicoaceticum TaxID=51515 RepID=A0ABT1Y0K2_9FIRM|nr:adenine deaminase [Dehalobacterium formicoaceticum]MCR6544380.1 adenine deaminase [Dehalobacterium formicoaceticum]
MLYDMIRAARGEIKPALVLKNAKLINVFSGEIYPADIAVDQGRIVGIGSYSGVEEKDLAGCCLCPGLIDGHIHLESTMVTPGEFAKTVLPRGTTSVVTDPHEIANVCGLDGITYMLDSTENLPLNVFFMVPSCVPATSLEDNGAEITAENVLELLDRERILGLAEMMNYPGVLTGDPHVLAKLDAAKRKGKIIDGHAPGLSGKDLCAYVAAGITSDHECTTYSEGLEKIRLGQWVMVREGTAGKNMQDLLPLLLSEKSRRSMLVTDDKHPGDLLREGHLDGMIRTLIAQGVRPLEAIRMATLNPAQYFGLKDLGAIAPGYRADFLVLSDLKSFEIKEVYKDGRLAAQKGKALPFEIPAVFAPTVLNSFHIQEVKPEQLILSGSGTKMRVIGLVPGQILTREIIVDLPHQPGEIIAWDPEQDLVKLVMAERHKNTGLTAAALVQGFGLKKGAIASSVSHDSHNLVAIGTEDQAICRAANAVAAHQGGLAIADGDQVLAILPLPIAGLMSTDGVEKVDLKLQAMKELAWTMGVPRDLDPFMMLSFLALPVIPELKLTPRGLIKVDEQKLVPAVF